MEPVAAKEVGVAAGFDDRHVAVHDDVLGVGFAEDLGGSGHVVEVGLAVEEDFGVGVAEAELLDAVADLGRRGLEVGVDENVAGGGGDEVGGEVAAADVVEVVGDLERGEGSGPLRLDLGGSVKGDEENESGEKAAHRYVLTGWAVRGGVGSRAGIYEVTPVNLKRR